MTDKVIRLLAKPDAEHRLVIPHPLPPLGAKRLDQLRRPLRDLRISVTDRCNFRCVYCMPKQVFDKDYAFLPHRDLLSFEELTRVARLFIANGVSKIRLTGGEPLLRKDLEKLLAMLSNLTTASGQPLDLALTTNGVLLAKKAQALKEAGLRRVTVSLDAIDDAIFKRINDVDFSAADVLNGIQAAQDAGLGPIKVNCVIKRGINDQQIVPLARHFKNTPIVLRFIEYMDVGASNGWQANQVLSAAEIVQRIHALMPLQKIESDNAADTASRWRYCDGGGEIGVIASVSEPFCGDCTRIRVSPEGKLFTCLFATHGHDLRQLLRDGNSDAEISGAIAQLWQTRADRYSEQRAFVDRPADSIGNRIEMSYIGG